MIQLQNISKTYKLKNGNEFTALKGLNLEIRRGEFVVIYGKSGSGKSTLLNILGGLDKVSSGQFIIDNKSTENYKDIEWDYYRNKSVGFVFQSFNLISHLTARENVQLALEISKNDTTDKSKKVEEMLKKVGLEHQMDKKPGYMSGGQQQRIAIARALINNPQIILADEPTGSLDTETSNDIMNLLKEVAKDKIVIMVTHNQEMIENYGTRIIKIKDGMIEEDIVKEKDTQQVDTTVTNKAKKVSLSFTKRLSFSLNNIKLRWSRFLFSSLIFSIGIVVLLLILSLGEGILNYYTEKEKAEQNIHIVPYYYTGRLRRNINPIWIQEVEELNNVDIRVISGGEFFHFSYYDSPRFVRNFGILYRNTNNNDLEPYLLKGRFPENKNEIAISSVALAGFKRIYDEGSNSDNLDLIDSYTVYEEEEVLAFYQEKLKDQILTLHIPTEAHEYGKLQVKIVGILKSNEIPYRPYTENNPNNPFSMVDILLYKEIYTQIDDVVTINKFVVEFKKYDRNNLFWTDSQIKQVFEEDNMPIRDKYYKWENINKIYNIILTSEAMLSLFGVLILMGGAVTISIIINMSVLEQRKNIGILRSLGVRKKDIRRIFRSEGILIGLVGAIFGILITYILVTILNPIALKSLSVLLNVRGETYDILILKYWMIVPILFMGLLFGMIGANKPAKAATKINPIEALQSGAEL